METLFGLFFRNFIPFLPIIHEPTFRAQYADGLQKRNTGFAVVVLLVCAIASRYCDDPRVCLKDGGSPSAGWKYFVQVKDLKRSLHAPATLSDLQTYAVCTICLRIFTDALLTYCAAGRILSTSNKRPAFSLDRYWYRHSLCPRYWRTSTENLQRHYLSARRTVEKGLLVRGLILCRTIAQHESIFLIIGSQVPGDIGSLCQLGLGTAPGLSGRRVSDTSA